ncbi:MAG: coproporphyrinogen III oxidase [Phycisphaerae bacterium]|nr:coproporphyrinogen III oxidase [Phycisphaerae bacterium]
MDLEGITLPVLGDAARNGIDAAGLLEGARPESIYAHVPFCRHKCHYCDFYSVVDRRDRSGDFTIRFEEEARTAAGLIDSSAVRTVFVGGGTPTMLSPAELERVLKSIRLPAGEADLDEFTVEANPETVDEGIAAALFDSGVDRVSIGCQSFDPRHLQTLERHHDPDSVPRAIDRIREAGIERVSLDLIFGIPGSTLQDWERDLERALSLEPDHLSCYGLVFEPGTALDERRRRGRIEPIDDAIEAAMYQLTRERLREEGFGHYEVSNWARPGERSEHNLVYWNLGEWMAMGPAGAGNLRGVRYRNVPRLDDWLSSEGPSRIVDVERPQPSIARGERFMLGLRLRDGMPRGVVESLLRDDPGRRSMVEDLLEAGRLEWWQEGLRISEESLMTADEVLSRLV